MSIRMTYGEKIKVHVQMWSVYRRAGDTRWEVTDDLSKVRDIDERYAPETYWDEADAVLRAICLTQRSEQELRDVMSVRSRAAVRRGMDAYKSHPIWYVGPSDDLELDGEYVVSWSSADFYPQACIGPYTYEEALVEAQRINDNLPVTCRLTTRNKRDIPGLVAFLLPMMVAP